MSTTERIRVMIVDDHPIMRDGLRDALESEGNFEVVGQAGDGVEAVWSAQRLKPEVFVLEELADLVKQLPVGKRVGGDWYIHRDALKRYGATLFDVVSGYAAADAAFQWNVCKLSPARRRISLLNYPCFRKQAHPTLAAALTVDLDRGVKRVRRYSAGGNRPILHRKELLIDTSDPDYQRFAALTVQEERAGLFARPSVIGHERGWAEQLERRGLSIHDHELRGGGGQVRGSTA